MRNLITRAASAAACCALTLNPLLAQRGSGDWMTAGSDVQRSNWVRGDGKITPETMVKPGFQFLWKVDLKNQARALNSISNPSLIDFFIGHRGFRTLGFFASSSGKLTGIDTDLARIEWTYTPPGGTVSIAPTDPCPGGMSAGITRPAATGYPPAGFAGRGRAGAAKSGVGLPGEGAVTLKDVRPPQPPPAPPAGRANRRTAAAPNPFARQPQWVVAVTADGKLHQMYLSNGEEPNPPIDFIPANAHAVGLMVFDGVAYVATKNGCGGDDGVWSVELASKKVSSWKGPVEGTLGAAAGPEGTLYVASGSDLVSLAEGTLAKQASYSAGAKFTSSPVVFEYKGKDMVAAAASDGRIHVASGDLKPAAKSDAYSPADYPVGALASWQDASGTRWILAATGNAITAWKLVESGGSVSLAKGWTSREMVSPITPAVVSGVAFAVSSGLNRSASAADRAKRSSKAVLYALDPLTGKELWNSGSTITSFVSTGGISAGGGRVYVGGHDGVQYAFGFPMEH